MSTFSPDLADCFCELWDAYAPAWAAAPPEPTSGEELLTRLVPKARAIVAAGEVSDDHRREVTDEGTGLDLAIAIDMALMEVHPSLRTTAGSRALPRIVARYDRTGMLQHQAPGALLWRHAEVAPSAEAETLFGAVTRISPDIWDQMAMVRPHTLDDVAAVPPEDLVLGCVPIAMSLEDFEIARIADEYSIAPRTCLGDPAHIRSVLEALDASGAHIGLLPEYVLDDVALGVWQEEIKQAARRPTRLRWVLVGTGPIGAEGPVPPNCAVVLSRVTGEVLWRQHKRHRFLMKASQLSDWTFDRLLHSNCDLDERIDHSGVLTLVESINARFVLLICEDLAHSERPDATVERGEPKYVDPLVRQAAPSWLLVPVLDRELGPDRWEKFHAKEWASWVGCHTVVANSAAVAAARAAAGKLTEEAVRHSLAIWSVDDDVEIDPDGRPGGGVGAAAVTLHASPLAADV